ncbi:MAG: hypothetical protein NTW07_08250, partial [candidate division Zixibacteria bacterium]|nr:hypothetical protein [candidate division Zixibacteria bacterium]
MLPTFTFVFASILAVTAPALTLSERQAEHQIRLSGLDLGQRTLPMAPGAISLSSANGDDFRISLSRSPARFAQDRSRVLSLANRDWWVVWEDDRFGSRKILRQWFDSLGNPRGGNSLLAGSDIGASYTEPHMALDTLGRIYFSWRDQTGGMIFVTRFASNGAADWSPLLVNDTSLSSFAGLFDMAVFGDGQVVLAWENYSALGSTIQMRIFSANGTSLLGPTPANSDGGSASHWAPSVANAPGSGFLVCWEDYRNGQPDIFARQFTGAGSPVGADFTLVPPPADEAAQYTPRVAYSQKDKYVLGWIDLREGQEIYLQRYSQTSGLVGTNQLVSSGLDLVVNRDPDLSVSTNGLIHLVWSASGADNSIQSLMLDSGLVPAGLPEVINLTSLGQRWAPAANFSRQNDYAITWTESGDDDPDIALMLYNQSGTRRLPAEVTVNDDQQGAPSVTPGIVATTNWWNVVCYASGGYDQGDIFVRTISNAGSFLGDEIRINQDIGHSLQSEPRVSIANGHTLLIWNDARTLAGFSGQRIFGRRLNAYGVPSGGEFIVSDSSALAPKNSPRLTTHSDGMSLAVWIDHRDGSPQVYGTWLESNGTRNGTDFRLSQPAEDKSVVGLSAESDTLGGTAVIWLDAGSASPTVRGRRFNPDRSPGSSISYSPGSALIEEMACAVAPDGRAGLFWVGSESGVKQGYLTLLAFDGSVIAGPITVTDSDESDPSAPAIAICNNGYFSLTWLDRRGGRTAAYYRIYDPALTPLAASQAVSSATPESMQEPAVSASRGRAWFVWSDPRQDGLNIYAGNLLYLPTDVDDNPSVLPAGYVLSQNYPNPFNPSTEIDYTIPSSSSVELTVYNSLGQRVAVLDEGYRAAGSYRVTWDGRDFTGARAASG